MPVAMYRDDEYAVVENCLVEERKREGWGVTPPAVKVAEESAAEETEVESTEELQQDAEPDEDMPGWLG